MSANGSSRRRALAVVAPLTSQRLVGRCGRRRATTIAVVDIVLHVLVELLEKEGALQTHLLHAPVQAQDALAGRVVGLFDVVDAATDVDTFAVVCAFDRRRKILL